jgi:hypothetical protein
MSEQDLRALFGARQVEARVLLNLQLLDEHDRLEAEHAAAIRDDANRNEMPKAPEIAQRLVELEDRIAAEEVVFVLQSIGTKAWLKLAAEHPPTREERLAGYDNHEETFQPAAVIASTVEVRNLPDGYELTPELVAMMREVLPIGEWDRLWAPVIELNVGSSKRPKSLAASVHRRLSSRSSDTASPEGSLAASS